jgi:hypothetical protein
MNQNIPEILEPHAPYQWIDSSARERRYDEIGHSFALDWIYTEQNFEDTRLFYNITRHYQQLVDEEELVWPRMLVDFHSWLDHYHAFECTDENIQELMQSPTFARDQEMLYEIEELEDEVLAELENSP